MKNKILHIMDDEKVVDRTIGYFESIYPGQNIFVVMSDRDRADLIYVKKIDKIYKCDYKNIRFIEDKVKDARHVIIHMLE